MPNLVHKLKDKSYEEQLELVYHWIKHNIITQEEFQYLLSIILSPH